MIQNQERSKSSASESRRWAAFAIAVTMLLFCLGAIAALVAGLWAQGTLILASWGLSGH